MDLTGDLRGANLSGITLINIDLSGRDMSGANLSGADLSGADLRRTNLRGANLTGTNLSGAKLRAADLSGSILTGTTLLRAKMSGANMSYTDLTGIIGILPFHLQNVNFSHAVMTGLDLSDRNLSASNFFYATMIGTNTRDANLAGANLRSANLTNADMLDVNLSGANLSYTIFTHAVMTGANLENSRMVRADLTNADLRGAILINTNLELAVFTGANLTHADLTGAIMRRTNFTGARIGNLIIENGMTYDEAVNIAAQMVIENNDPELAPVLNNNNNNNNNNLFAPTGRAFEVHIDFDKIKDYIPTYLDILKEINTKEDEEYLASNIAEYCKSILLEFINIEYDTLLTNAEAITNNVEKDTKKVELNKEKHTLIENLNKVINKAKDLINSDSNKLIIGRTIDFIKNQPSEFVLEYTKSFVFDCVNAYEGANGMSCVKGIVERFISILLEKLELACLEGCPNPIYDSILKLFNKKLDLNDVIQEWSEKRMESNNLKIMTRKARKDDFINYAIKKYTDAGLLTVNTQRMIEEEAIKLNSTPMFEGLILGGKNQRLIANKKKGYSLKCQKKKYCQRYSLKHKKKRYKYTNKRKQKF